MSNTRRIGKHSMAVVHRTVKRGKKARRYGVGSSNRRLITLETFEAPGWFTYRKIDGVLGLLFVTDTVTKERQYHFTKGYRVRTA